MMTDERRRTTLSLAADTIDHCFDALDGVVPDPTMTAVLLDALTTVAQALLVILADETKGSE